MRVVLIFDGRQNETPLSAPQAADGVSSFAVCKILSFFCRLFLSIKERKTAVLVEDWRRFCGANAVDSTAKKRTTLTADTTATDKAVVRCFRNEQQRLTERKTAVLVEGWRLFCGINAVAGTAEKRPV